MKFRGGYNINLAGRPGQSIEPAPTPERLHLSLESPLGRFVDVRVSDGQEVLEGQTLAVDVEAFNLPLIAPRPGRVRVLAEDRPPRLTIETAGGRERIDAPDGPELRRLLALGAWEFVVDPLRCGVAEPAPNPDGIIVSTIALEPFVARGDAMLDEDLDAFCRGLERLQTLLDYQSIHLVLPVVGGELARRVREALRGRAYLQLHDIPLRYGLDDPTVLARRLSFRASKGHRIWFLRTEGVLAVEQALGRGEPVTDRVIAVGGPAVKQPRHVRTPVGASPWELLGISPDDPTVRAVRGGVFRGGVIGPDCPGLDGGVRGLTVLGNQPDRELLSFARAGFDRTSYSRFSFASGFVRPAPEKLTTALRGEQRACVSCGFCEEVCPARILPYQIHKMLYQDRLEEAEAAGADLCVDCGLCSYVCPSKIELRKEIVESREMIWRELHE